MKVNKPSNKVQQQMLYILRYIIFVSIAMAVILLWPKLIVGDEIRTDDDQKLVQFREDFEITMNAFTNNIQLITAAFGVIAFLLTYRENRNKSASKLSSSLLMGSIIMLSGALLFCLFGREIMLKMIADNMAALNYWPLILCRWIAYSCMVIAAVLISFFTLELYSKPTAENIEAIEKSAD